MLKIEFNHLIRVSEILGKGGIGVEPPQLKQEETQVEKENVVITNSVQDIKIIPNPTTGQVTVNFELPENMAYTIEVFDPTGKTARIKVPKRDGSKGINEYRMDLSSLEEGIYFLKLNTSQSTNIEKVVITK